MAPRGAAARKSWVEKVNMNVTLPRNWLPKDELDENEDGWRLTRSFTMCIASPSS